MQWTKTEEFNADLNVLIWNSAGSWRSGSDTSNSASTYVCL